MSTIVNIKEPYKKLNDPKVQEEDECECIAKSIGLFAPGVITLGSGLGSYLIDPTNDAYGVLYAITFAAGVLSTGGYLNIARTTKCKDTTANVIVMVGMALTIAGVVMAVLST